MLLFCQLHRQSYCGHQESREWRVTRLVVGDGILLFCWWIKISHVMEDSRSSLVQLYRCNTGRAAFNTAWVDVMLWWDVMSVQGVFSGLYQSMLLFNVCVCAHMSVCACLFYSVRMTLHIGMLWSNRCGNMLRSKEIWRCHVGQTGFKEFSWRVNQRPSRSSPIPGIITLSCLTWVELI